MAFASEVVSHNSKKEQDVELSLPREPGNDMTLPQKPWDTPCTDLVGKVRKCTRNMAHTVTETCTSPEVQGRVDIAMGGFCALFLLPLINLLTLLIGNSEMFWGFYYKSVPMQLHGGYLTVCWVYVTYIGLCHFYIQQPSNRYSPKTSFRFRLGHGMAIFVGAQIIFSIFFKFHFLNEPVEPLFDIDQTLLLMVGFVITVMNIGVLYIMRPDEGPWGEIIRPPFEINAYRHLKCCSFGAIISLVVYDLDLAYGFDSRRDTLLLSYYFWAILYCAFTDMSKFINNLRTGNIMVVYKRPRIMVIARSSNV